MQNNEVTVRSDKDSHKIRAWLRRNDTWANRVTSLRALLLPVAIIVFCLGFYPHAFVLTAVIAILDGLDGWLARRLGEQTLFGESFDSFVDKVTTLSMQFVLFVYPGPIALPWRPLAFIVFFLSVALEAVLAASRIERVKKRYEFVERDAARTPGKAKMWTQCIYMVGGVLGLALMQGWMLHVARAFLVLSPLAVLWSISSRLKKGRGLWQLRLNRIMTMF